MNITTLSLCLLLALPATAQTKDTAFHQDDTLHATITYYHRKGPSYLVVRPATRINGTWYYYRRKKLVRLPSEWVVRDWVKK